jgi:hypothetical protein
MSKPVSLFFKVVLVLAVTGGCLWAGMQFSNNIEELSKGGPAVQMKVRPTVLGRG